MKDSREYRLPTEKETEDESHLSPHTPVATDVNDSYPNSENEDDDAHAHNTSGEKAHTAQHTYSQNHQTKTDQSSSKVSGKKSFLNQCTQTAVNNWQAIVIASIALAAGAVVVYRKSM